MSSKSSPPMQESQRIIQKRTVVKVLGQKINIRANTQSMSNKFKREKG